MEKPTQIEPSEEYSKQELVEKSKKLFEKAREESDNANGHVSHFIANVSQGINYEMLSRALEDEEEKDYVKLVIEHMDMLERYFILKETYPEIIQKIKEGEFDNHPEFEGIITRTDKSQSELMLEAFESIVELEKNK